MILSLETLSVVMGAWSNFYFSFPWIQVETEKDLIVKQHLNEEELT